MIGSKELAMMRRDAILINTARGGLVDEQALIAALTSGVIGGGCEPELAMAVTTAADFGTKGAEWRVNCLRPD